MKPEQGHIRFHPWPLLAAICLLAIASLGVRAQDNPSQTRQDFVPPAAGSYPLQVIQTTPDGSVLDSDGSARPFNKFTTGRITVLSFIYTACADPEGCPLSYVTLRALRERLLARPELARASRFVSLSFDPQHDTPTAMKAYGGELASTRSPLRWHFVTTRSIAQLAPIISDLGQDVAVQQDAYGQPTRLFNHMLKVFLIDPKGRVREIYTTAFLQPDVMFNDIETLWLEAHQAVRK